MADTPNISDVGFFNENILIFDRTAVNTTTLSSIQTNDFFKGVEFLTNITVAPGVDSITLALFSVDPVSGAMTIVQSGPVYTTTGLKILTFYPGITVGASDFSELLPFNWILGVTHIGAGLFTYTVSASRRL